MHDLSPTSPLGSRDARVDTFDGLRIAERTDQALASLAVRAGRADAAREAAERFLGVALPEPGRAAAGDPFSVFWTGAGQWMIEAPHDSHEDLAGLLAAAMGDAASVTEQSDGWARFDLGGPRCHDVLERLCNADTRAMVPGAATRSRVEQLGCFVLMRAEEPHFSILGPRSSAGSLHEALVTAARSAL